jgi:hypothetical protein
MTSAYVTCGMSARAQAPRLNSTVTKEVSPSSPGSWAGYRVRIEVIGTDPPAAIGFVEEWPGFTLIGTSVLDVLSRMDGAMAAWAAYEKAAGRAVPPPHRPRIAPPRRSHAEPEAGS